MAGGYQPQEGGTPSLPTTGSGVKPAPGFTVRQFDYNVDRGTEVITIQGIRYSFELFDQLGFGPEGRTLRIGKRTDGAVTLHTIDAAMEADADRGRMAKLVEETSKHAPSLFDDPKVRMALLVAAHAVRRGRHLTDREKLLNLAKGMEEPIEGDTPEDIAAAKGLADRIRAAAGAE